MRAFFKKWEEFCGAVRAIEVKVGFKSAIESTPGAGEDLSVLIPAKVVLIMLPTVGHFCVGHEIANACHDLDEVVIMETPAISNEVLYLLDNN